MGLETILTDPKFDAIIDAVIIFFISLITELLALPGIPTGAAIYHALLVACLAGLVFFAKKRGVQNINRSDY